MRNKIVLGLVAILGVFVLACGASPDSSSAGGQSKAEAGGAVAATGGTVAASSAAPAAPKGPWTSFADGTYEIGTGDGQVAPGKYKTTVPDDSFNCYWERLKDTSGGFDAIIANDNASKGEPVIVTIGAKDGAFKTSGCGTWQKA